MKQYIVAAFLVFAPLQAIRLQSQTVQNSKNPMIDAFQKTEIVSKYGIMYSMDVFPQHYQSSDEQKLAPGDFSSLSLAKWKTQPGFTPGVDLARYPNRNTTELHRQSVEHGSNVINHKKYADAINAEGKSAIKTVYVIASALPAFVQMVLPKLTKPFVLVTGDSILPAPSKLFKDDESFTEFMNNKLLVHWFAQNGHSEHPKFTGIPNGLDYHTLAVKTPEFQMSPLGWGPHMSPQEQENMLKKIASESPDFAEKKTKVFVGFQGSQGHRNEARAQLMKSPNVAVATRGTREQFWKQTAATKYSASPAGYGWDCHRTWEALALGTVPIVERTGMSKLFTDHNLPVGIVDQWQEVSTLEPFQLEAKFGKNTKELPEAMKLQYWVNLIQQKTKQ